MTDRSQEDPTAPPAAHPAGAPGPSPAAAGAARPASATLVLIGAGHVFDIRRAMRDAVVAFQPDVVCVELDRGRLEALLARDRGEAPPPRGTYVQRRLARFQEGVAAMYGAEVGGEMLGAVDGARQVGSTLAMVDDPAQDTVRKAIAALSVRERFRLLGMLLGAGAKSLLPRRRRDPKAQVEAELARYQADPGAVLGDLARKLPNLHRVLITERDEAMARRIRAACEGKATAGRGRGADVRAAGGSERGPVVLAVLGDGHMDGIVARLADLAPRVYRLADVREGRLPRGLVAMGTTEQVGFSLRTRT